MWYERKFFKTLYSHLSIVSTTPSTSYSTTKHGAPEFCVQNGTKYEVCSPCDNNALFVNIY